MFPLSFSRARLRAAVAAAVVAGSVALTGCQTDGVDMAKAMKPLSAEMLALIESKGMDKNAPILVRIFKEESELEVWKKNRDGEFALLKTYPICRWSGELGPKIKQGDRQAPEGFYTITPAQMNPRSQYYLSFNLGYPNAFDRAHGRTGSHLMVHGACSSAGCYSMTDEQIAEIYALGREAFFGGQKTFQVQAYPFRMTPLNMARHRNNPHFAFWKMLKVGYDHFEVARAEPKVEVCEKRYVFDPQQPPGSTEPLRFNPTARCPDYVVPPEIADAVAAKEKRDELAFAELVKRGTPTVPTKMGLDGGMHPSFVALLNPQHVRDENGNVRWLVENPSIGTKIPRVTTASADPRITAPVEAPATVASIQQAPATVPMPRPAPRRRAYVSRSAPPAATASNASEAQKSPGVIDDLLSAPSRAASSVARVFGFAREEPKPTPEPKVNQARRAPTHRVATKPRATPTPPEKPAAQTVEAETPAKPPLRRSAEAKPAEAKTSGDKPAETHATARPASSGPTLISGSQPVLPSGGFENRWPGSFR